MAPIGPPAELPAGFLVTLLAESLVGLLGGPIGGKESTQEVDKWIVYTSIGFAI